MHFAVQKDVSLTVKYGKTRWRPGLCPDPAGGAPQTPSRLGRGHPSQTPPAQRLRRFDLNFGVPVVVNLRNDHFCLYSVVLMAEFDSQATVA